MGSPRAASSTFSPRRFRSEVEDVLRGDRSSGEAKPHRRSFLVLAHLAVVEVDAIYLQQLGEVARVVCVLAEPKAPVTRCAHNSSLSHRYASANLHEESVDRK